MTALKQARHAARNARLVYDDNQQELVAIPVKDWEVITAALNTTLAVPAGSVILPRVLTEAMMQAGWPADTAQEGYTAMIAARPEVAAIEIPPALAEIGKLLATQDNRFTDQPMFVVQQKIAAVADEDYNAERIVWASDDGDHHDEADEQQAAELEAEYQSTFEVRPGWRRLPMCDYWDFATASFTEKGCQDYLTANGHNLREPRIYAQGSFRNTEYQAVRAFLLSLAYEEVSHG